MEKPARRLLQRLDIDRDVACPARPRPGRCRRSARSRHSRGRSRPRHDPPPSRCRWWDRCRPSPVRARPRPAPGMAWVASAPTSRGCPGGGSVRRYPESIGRGQAGGAQAEIMICAKSWQNAPPLVEGGARRRVDQSGIGIEVEPALDPGRQRMGGIEHAPIRAPDRPRTIRRSPRRAGSGGEGKR